MFMYMWVIKQNKIMKKKVLCSAEKSSVIWAEPHSRSSAEQFSRTERSVGHYHSDNKAVQMRVQKDFDPIVYVSKCTSLLTSRLPERVQVIVTNSNH